MKSTRERTFKDLRHVICGVNDHEVSHCVAHHFTSRENHEHRLTWLCCTAAKAYQQPASSLPPKGCTVSITMEKNTFQLYFNRNLYYWSVIFFLTISMVDSWTQFREDATTMEIKIDGEVKDRPVVTICGVVFPKSMLMTWCNSTVF